MKSLLPSACLLLGTLYCSVPVYGQKGDRPGHEMTPPPKTWKIPEAPVVSPEKAASTIALEKGFELELVVSEPMIHDPVALAFDGNGRMWVAEMIGYMPDIDGKLEETTYGQISVLEDTNGDGKMDRRTVFLEDYLLPRAVALVDNDRTLLFADNLKLYEAPILIDEQGKITAGDVTVVDETFAEGGNPEHKANGLMRAVDNWIYNAKSNCRYKKIDGVWVKETTEDRGQWGIVQDNYGRLYTNTNSNLISAEEVPPGVRVRNPNYSFRTRVVTTMENQRLWSARINPGVNRGYMDGVLSEDGHLLLPTAVSGLAVYRGDQYPAEYDGQLFIPEPAGNLVKRAKMTEDEAGFRTIESAVEGSEFFTSVDERSRIVNVHNAPDGTLYFVDFYRGIIQHTVYMTSYLRAQVEERELDKHIGYGRIWRIRHQGGKTDLPRPEMDSEATVDLVAHLTRPNGWWRDTAQRLIVERGADEATIEALRGLITEGSNELAVIHAVWTLEGLEKLSPEILQAALANPYPRAVAESVRAAETFVGKPEEEEVFNQLSKLIESDNIRVRHQVAASLGLFGEKSIPFLAKLVQREEEDLLTGDLAVSGLSGMEFVLFSALPETHNLRGALIETIVKRNDASELKELTARLKTPADYRALAKASAAQRRIGEVRELLTLIASEEIDAKLREAIVAGLLQGSKDKKFKAMPVKELDSLDLAVKRKFVDAKQGKQLAALFKVGSGEEEVFLLTEADRAQYKLGEAQYQVICLGCHQAHGNGQQSLAPPLVGSEWVLESEQRLIALVMDGLMGPIEVLGKVYTVPEIQPLMPGLRLNPELDDEKLAAILTYVRNAWGNGAPPVSTEAVAKYRGSVEARAPWTPEELKQVK